MPSRAPKPPFRAPDAAADHLSHPTAGRLTQRFINEIQSSGLKQRIADHEVKGLFLRITPAGAKSYVLRYSKDGRRGESAIGDARSITLAAARVKAISLLNGLTVQSIDPVTAKREAIAATQKKKKDTFEALARAYQIDAARRKRPRSLELETWLLERHVLPYLGARPFVELKRSEIIAFIESVGDNTGHVTANRAHGLVRQILNYALRRELIDANPALGIERVFPEASRERVLTGEELARLWAWLEAARANRGLGLLSGQPAGQRPVNGVSSATATALQLCLLTLQRAGEVSGARREEFHWNDRLWVIPAERMKSKRAHAAPLSDMALALFQEAFERSGGPFAFPDRSRDAPLDPKRLTRGMARACKILRIPPAGPHDLRRTGRTIMTSERVGVSYETAERVIAHLVGSAVSRVYDRNEYLREKRAALTAWERELKSLVTAESTITS